MSRKHILIIAPFLTSSPKKGYEHFVHQYTSAMLGRGNQVTLVCLGRDDNRNIESFDHENLNMIIASPSKFDAMIGFLKACTYRKPLQSYKFLGLFKKKVNRIISDGEFDDIVCFMVRCAACLPASLVDRTKVVAIDPISASFKWRSKFEKFPMNFIFYLDSLFSKSFEEGLASKAANFFLINRNDFNLIKVTNNRIPQFLTYGTESNESDVKVFVKRFKSRTILITGRLDYIPNINGIINFAKLAFISDLIKNNFKVIVVGRGRYTSDISKLEKNNTIEIKGEVPSVIEELDTAFCSACFVDFPHGIQTKVIEALSIGLPVLANKEIFSSFSNSYPGECPIILVNDVLELDIVLSRLMSSESEYLNISERSIDYAQKHFSWENTIEEIEAE